MFLLAKEIPTYVGGAGKDLMFLNCKNLLWKACKINKFAFQKALCMQEELEHVWL
jgi:hypothetical protein